MLRQFLEGGIYCAPKPPGHVWCSTVGKNLRTGSPPRWLRESSHKPRPRQPKWGPRSQHRSPSVWSTRPTGLIHSPSKNTVQVWQAFLEANTSYRTLRMTALPQSRVLTTWPMLETSCSGAAFVVESSTRCSPRIPQLSTIPRSVLCSRERRWLEIGSMSIITSRHTRTDP